MSAIKFACISPHPPIIVREVGRGREREVQRTIDALEQVAADIGLHRPETVFLMATHGPPPSQPAREPRAAGRGGAGRSELPLDAAARWDGGLDWSVTVPLYYLRCGMATAPLTPMNVSFLSARKHFELGNAVRRAVDRVGRRAVTVASAH